MDKQVSPKAFWGIVGAMIAGLVAVVAIGGGVEQALHQDRRADEAQQRRQADDSGLDDRAEAEALIKRTEGIRKARREEAKEDEEAEYREAVANGRAYAIAHFERLTEMIFDGPTMEEFRSWCETAADYSDEGMIEAQDADRDPWITGCIGYAVDLERTLN